jgi:putative nucleotidyltransferase with HDIG domain
MKMKKEKIENEESGAQILFGSMKKYVKNNYPVLIIFVLSFIAAAGIAFVRIATSNTVSSFDINDYEVGQIADRTIYAQKTLPADYTNPISVEKGEKITRKGFAITDDDFAKLKKLAESPAYIDPRAFANSILYLMLLSALWFFLLSPVCLGRKPEFKEVLLQAIFFIIVYAVTAFGSKAVLFSSPYAIPVIIPASLCTLLVAILFGQLSAVFFAILISFGVLNACAYQVVPFLFVLASSLSASRIVRRIQRRIDMVFVALLMSLLDVVFLATFKIIFSDTFADAVLTIPGVAFNGFISGILALGFLTPLESMLNTASVFRLMDLSDLNNPLMRKMLLTASGTYNHSMMVASLAESACREIGANSLIARVGAYYHDIGKMDQPEYFVENQNGGENKHNEINPSLSVSVIRSHVKKGVEKARAMRMPKQVVDIIGEHHGNSVIAYFYNEAHNKDPNVNPEDFAYNGNPPSTRESAVVMLADTVEAACRTLDKPSVPRLDKFIQQLIEGKIEHHQLDNCDLTFKDLDTIRNSFVQILAGYYHSRIEYPEQKDPDEGKLGEKTLSEARGENAPQPSNRHEGKK